MHVIPKVVSLLVFFTSTCAIAADSLPDPLKGAVLKQVVMNAHNPVYADVRQQIAPDSLPLRDAVLKQVVMHAHNPVYVDVRQQIAPDSMPLKSMLLKKAVMDSLNSRYANVRQQLRVPDSLTFSRLGLEQLQTGARHEFMQYLNAGNGKAGIEKMQRMFNSFHDSAKVAGFIDNKLRGFYALRQQSIIQLPAKPDNKLKDISWQTIYSDTTAMLSPWWNEGIIRDQLTIGSIPIQLNYSTLTGYRDDVKTTQLFQLNFDRQAYLDKVNRQLQQSYNLNKYFLDDIDIKSSIQGYLASQLSAFDSLKGHLSPDQLMLLDSAQLANALQQTPQAYQDKVMRLKQQLGDVREMNRLTGEQKAAQQKIASALQHPENAARIAPDLLNMSALQRFMMHVKELKVGSIGTLSDVFMTGASGSYLKGNKFMMLALGKTKELGIQDMGMQSATGNNSYAMQYLRMGRGDIGNKQTHLSVLNANAKPQLNNGFNTAVLSRNVFVGSISKQCDLGSLGKIDIDLSKSSSQIGNNGLNDAAAVSKSAASHFMNDLWATAAIGLAYTGDVRKWGLSQKMYMNYSGLGYVNPGSPFGSRGALQYGLVVRRNWLKNKATATVRMDVRNQAISPLTDEKRRGLQLSADARYRFNRRLTMNVNLLQHTLRENSTTVFLNRKLTVMSQANGKVAGILFTSNASLGIQQMNYQSLKSLFVNVAGMQTFMAGPGMVITNVYYNRDVKNAAIYNNLLNIDAGYQYTLWKNISCGSSLIYMDSKDVVRQIGLRQQVTAQLFRRWSLAIAADGRKNLINTTANYYYGRFNTTTSLHYQIN